MVKLIEAQRQDLFAHAMEARPNMACGLLGGRQGRVLKVYRTRNKANSPTRYEIEPHDLIRCHLDLEANDMEVVGVYRSDVFSEAYPSATDVRLAYYPDALYFLVSPVDDGNPVLRAFRILKAQPTDDKGEITEEPIEVEAAASSYQGLGKVWPGNAVSGPQGASRSSPQVLNVARPPHPQPSSPAPRPAASALARDLAACCLLKLHRAPEAEAVLCAAPAGPDGPARSTYLGLALARQGRVVEALRCLRMACQQATTATEARPALLALLKTDARQRIARRDWDGAGAALSQALEIEPADPELQQMLSAIGNYLSVSYLKAGRRAEAAAVWEQAQAKDPTDPRLAHCLGLLYFWDAQQAEAQDDARAARAAWEGAIRNWVALRYADSFWSGWKAERERACGSIADAAVEGLRGKLVEQLGRRIADYQNDYLTRKQAADARRMGDLSLLLAAELQTAEALQRVTESLDRRGRKPPPLPPLCGVLMLQHLGQLETAQRLPALVKVTPSNEASVEQLHWCLSPWVYPWIIVQERRYQEAIDHLQAQLEQNPAEDGHELLATAYLEQGRLLATTGQIDAALTCWKAGLASLRSRKKIGGEIRQEAASRPQARRRGPARKKIADEIRQEAENTAVREATRLQSGGRANLERAIAVLEKARGVVDSQRVKDNLAELYTNLGVMESNDKSKNERARMERAQGYMERALRLNLNHVRARQNLSIVLANLGIARFSGASGPYGVAREEGVALLKRAVKLDPNNERALRKLLAMGETPDLDDPEELPRRPQRK
ncbi:MAG: Mov34/MPN/PAD-1 family protein [Chloroflexi bacterium]|nr:Mov34/MPN/PAD-1 family protein [Chloroflexota bacterium]